MANPLTLTDLPPLFPELVTVLCRPLGPARCRRPRRGRPPRNPACEAGPVNDHLFWTDCGPQGLAVFGEWKWPRRNATPHTRCRYRNHPAASAVCPEAPAASASGVKCD